MFVFPLLGDKQRFKFGGVMSIKYTHFIPMFLCYFCIFLVINKCSNVLNAYFFLCRSSLRRNGRKWDKNQAIWTRNEEVSQVAIYGHDRRNLRSQLQQFKVATAAIYGRDHGILSLASLLCGHDHRAFMVSTM